MYSKLKHWLTVLNQNAKKELIERPIGSIGVLVGIFVVVLPLLLSESLRGFVLYLLSRLLQPKIELNLSLLIIAIAALLAAALIPSKKEDKKKDHYFIEYDVFTWKVSSTSMGPYVDKLPYCKNHQTKMVSISHDLYVCPLCGSANAIEMEYARLRLIREAVESLAEAKYDDHLKI